MTTNTLPAGFLGRPDDAGRAESYYSQPVLQKPVWAPTIAAYFFTGGMAGASAGLAFAARRAGNDRLARGALLAAAAGLAVSPPLLIEDLGRPARFHHMLRVIKPTSPMSVGTWILSAFGTVTGAAAGAELLGIGRPAGRLAEAGAALFGLGLSTYTSALLANTAVPAWHRARHLLPFVFASSSAASAGAAATLLTPPDWAGPARRLAVTGAAAEVAISAAMERALGAVGETYQTGLAGRLTWVSRGLTAAGAGLLLAGGRVSWLARAGAAAVLAGSAFQRFAVLEAGKASAVDPRYGADTAN